MTLFQHMLAYHTIYEELLKEQDIDIQIHPEDFKNKEDNVSASEEKKPVIPIYELDFYLATDFKYECYLYGNGKYSAPYKHVTHFKEHLRRLQALEQIPLPEWLIQKAKQEYPYTWESRTMYTECRSWMKQQHIHRKYYEHIYQLAFVCGGRRNTIPKYTQYIWVHYLPTWVQVLGVQRSAIRKPKKYLPRYFILLQVLMDAFQIQLIYAIPEMKQIERQKRYYEEIQQRLRGNVHFQAALNHQLI